MSGKILPDLASQLTMAVGDITALLVATAQEDRIADYTAGYIGAVNAHDALAAKLEWRCFHCGEVFTEERCARLHFGADETHTPACQIKASEGGLLRALRESEAALQQAHWDMHDESAPALKSWRAALARHHAALIAMEETGYERGVADMRAEMAEGELVKALRAARQFISNGIELGYIRMPDPATPDSAHDTLPMIEAALTRLNCDQVAP